MSYQPKTGVPCSCKPGVHRDNCPDCEGTGWSIDFAKIRAASAVRKRSNGESLSDFAGRRVELVIQAKMGGYGWVACKYASDLVEANEKAMALASDPVAWMPESAALTTEQRLATLIRVVPWRDCSEGVAHAIREHNRTIGA